MKNILILVTQNKTRKVEITWIGIVKNIFPPKLKEIFSDCVFQKSPNKSILKTYVSFLCAAFYSN